MPQPKKKNPHHEPSDREKFQKVAQAIEAVAANRVVQITERHQAKEFEFLDVSTFDEVLD